MGPTVLKWSEEEQSCMHNMNAQLARLISGCRQPRSEILTSFNSLLKTELNIHSLKMK